METNVLPSKPDTVLNRICSAIAECYSLGENKMRKIYEFLLQDAENAVVASQNRFVLLRNLPPDLNRT